MSRQKARLALRITSTLSVPVVLLGLASAATAAPPTPPEVAIPGSESPKAAIAHKLSNAPATQLRTVQIALAPRDPQGLNQLLSNLSNPSSPDYRKYLTPQEYSARFGPTQQSVDQVVKFLESHGLQVNSIATGKQSISATGTNAQLSSAFATNLALYQDPETTGTFVGAEGAVKLPSSVATLVTNVAGLTDERAPFKPASRPSPDATGKTAQAKTLAPKSTDQGSGPKGGFTPAELRKAYNTASITGGNDGAGAVVALVEFSGHDASNPAAYDAQYGISAPAVENVNVDGGPTDVEGQGEVDLDIEVLHAIAPQAKILNYQSPNTGNADLDLYGAIVNDNRASIISSSWGLPEAATSSSHVQALSNIFKQAAAQGITVFSAAGDHGASDNWSSGSTALTVDSPSSDPNVTGVGGTRLSIDSSTGAWSSETVWNDYVDNGDTWRGAGGGGVSKFFTRPSWQTGVGVNLNQKRQVPDISSAAAEYQYSGYTELFDKNGNDKGPGWTAFAGTSAAAPLNAAFLALTSVKGGGVKFGNINPLIYQIAADDAGAFHDVTSGTNSIVGNAASYAATTGFDKASGWGSPVFPNFATGLLK
ncbi:protease pro-enzyme activation domain-containing protein [Psychromicrobium sp. YIM B11713]|uniref:S53 family peptidase n=1 Tax=Psychromicrobium sp. YIM B11713 TaxID=3145233 RepID=UPI00374FBB1C